MLGGVALAMQDIPIALIEGHGLKRRIIEQAGEAEIHFLLRDREPVLPAWHEGRLQLFRWGARRNHSRELPPTAWMRRETFAERLRVVPGAKEVTIPAIRALDNYTWYDVREGVRGAVLLEEQNQPVIYPLVEQSSPYYARMTHSRWMPCLVRQVI